MQLRAKLRVNGYMVSPFGPLPAACIWKLNHHSERSSKSRCIVSKKKIKRLNCIQSFESFSWWKCISHPYRWLIRFHFRSTSHKWHFNSLSPSIGMAIFKNIHHEWYQLNIVQIDREKKPVEPTCCERSKVDHEKYFVASSSLITPWRYTPSNCHQRSFYTKVKVAFKWEIELWSNFFIKWRCVRFLHVN